MVKSFAEDLLQEKTGLNHCVRYRYGVTEVLRQRLEMAERHGKTPTEKQYFSYRMKTQITAWGDRRGFEVLHDCSNKEWSGMLENQKIEITKIVQAHSMECG